MVVLSCAAMQVGAAYPLRVCDGVHRTSGRRTRNEINVLVECRDLAAGSERVPASHAPHGHGMTPASRRSLSHPSSTASLPRHLRPSYIFARGPKKLLRGILNVCATKTSNCFRKYKAEASPRSGEEYCRKKGGSAMPCDRRRTVGNATK